MSYKLLWEAFLLLTWVGIYLETVEYCAYLMLTSTEDNLLFFYTAQILTFKQS